MEQDIQKDLAEIKDDIKKIKNYMKWTFIITFVVVVLPILGLFVALPKFMSTFSDLQSLGL